MKPDPIEVLISRSLDETLSAEEQQILDRALAQSPEYRELADDLRRIKTLATLAPPVPASDLSARMQARVDSQYGQRGRVIAFRPRRNLIFAVAAAALFAAIIGWQWQQTDGEQIIDHQAQLQSELQSAREQYHAAIGKFEKVAREHLATLPADVADQYVDSLAVIDDAIRACEALTRDQPDAYNAYASLERAYQAKADLLENIMRHQ